MTPEHTRKTYVGVVEYIQISLCIGKIIFKAVKAYHFIFAETNSLAKNLAIVVATDLKHG